MITWTLTQYFKTSAIVRSSGLQHFPHQHLLCLVQKTSALYFIQTAHFDELHAVGLFFYQLVGFYKNVLGVISVVIVT